VLASVADGLTAGEIGVALGISRRTVEQHLGNVYEKLGVRTQAGAVARISAPRASNKGQRSFGRLPGARKTVCR
jgi:DNA-binding CsgD family transcriptional regulator